MRKRLDYWEILFCLFWFCFGYLVFFLIQDFCYPLIIKPLKINLDIIINLNIILLLSTNERSDRYNPCQGNIKCTCLPLNTAVSFIRKTKTKQKTCPLSSPNPTCPDSKQGSRNWKKEELVGYRENESRDHLMKELVTEERGTC